MLLNVQFDPPSRSSLDDAATRCDERFLHGKRVEVGIAVAPADHALLCTARASRCSTVIYQNLAPGRQRCMCSVATWLRSVAASP